MDHDDDDDDDDDDRYHHHHDHHDHDHDDDAIKKNQRKSYTHCGGLDDRTHATPRNIEHLDR